MSFIDNDDYLQTTAQTDDEEVTYQKYISQYAGNVTTDCSFEINAADFINGEGVSTETEYNGQSGATLITDDEGYAEWNVVAPQAGLYAISIDYFPIKGNGCAIQRAIYIDGKIPFDEALRR